MILWRFAVCSYLWKAHRDGLLDSVFAAEGVQRSHPSTVAAPVEHSHHPADVETALSGIRRALYPPPCPSLSVASSM